ncbi:unnamed protein product [Rotaria sordida]|uniref:FLYWCH-type domain-containing protein n=1 Tax=Rotaria sordida TaxID=392033 RepID=A0A813XYK4_9BILA|nr:unnamed protein product [Rotaria sordida]CAF1294653.1 unnamed protein product [Rotaria sordida]
MHLKEYSLAETKRHKPCLIYHGHRYVQDKIQNRTIYWRCEDRSHCNGRAHQLIGNGSLPTLTIKHNHPPIIQDLSRHDIVSVDSHRRRKRQNRKISPHQPQKRDALLFSPTSSTMTSPIKLENHQNKQQRIEQQHAAIVKNLHLSEVITTAVPPNISHYNGVTPYRHTMADPNEMTKLLNNITTTTTTTTVSTNSSLKTTSISPTIDYPSRLNHFTWEEIEGRYLPVIYRHENGISQRYISKMYVEHTLFESESWQRYTLLARSLPPLVSYSYTEYELKLFRLIIEWHLASFHFKTLPSSDCLICFEDLLDFYNNLRKLRDTLSTTTFNRPIAPLPRLTPVPLKPNIQSQSFELPTQILSSIKQQSKIHLLPQNPDIPSQINHRQQEQLLSSQKSSKESGWVQINNVFVPYIVKIKLRENELNKCHTRQPAPQLQREFYVPYEILIKCNIFSDNEFTLKKLLIKATQQDFDILNNLITNINIFDEKVPEKTLLVNLYHVMIGLNRIFYIKFLPTKNPRSQVNKYHGDILTHKGGTLITNGNRLIPYIVQNSRFYVPLLYTFHSVPNILIQAKRGARAPRQYEIDYLNLLFIYFSIDTQPLTSDTLLVDIFNIRCANLQSPIHFRTLHEHQQYEQNKLLNSVMRNQVPPKPTTGTSTTTHKLNKYPLTNVVVNPMIHHPSFYGLTTPKPALSIQKSVQQPDIKTIIYDNHVLNAIVKSSDISINDWKISVQEIFQKFSFNIDYQKFIQWCQTNLLLPLIKLDEDENQIIKNNQDDDNDYYVYKRNLDRCIELLNDIKRGSISMTLLPSSSNNEIQQQSMVKSPLAGAKKRKTTMPTTRHISPISTPNEINPLSNTIPQELDYPSPELPLPDEITQSITDEMSVKSPNDQVTFPTINDDNNNNNNNNNNTTTNNNNDDDDDDRMPVVASVEEEQPIEESIRTELDTSFIIVDSNDCNDEIIQLDDETLSCSSDYVSSAIINNININIHEDDEQTNSTIYSREHSSSCPSTISRNSSMISSKKQSKTNKKRQRNKNGKLQTQSRSITSRNIKKKCSINDQSLLVTVITKDKIEQHLRTLFMSSNEQKRTRTRPIKTPTRLVEEINTNNNNHTINMIEPDTNVFDILSSSITNETINNNEPIQNHNQSCTYNVIITDNPNKLGLTIKKVVQS